MKDNDILITLHELCAKMNSFPGTDFHLPPEDNATLCGLGVTSRLDSGLGVTEFPIDNNDIVARYESAASDILDIFSGGEVTKAQNGEFTTTEDELCFLFDPITNNSLSRTDIFEMNTVMRRLAVDNDGGELSLISTTSDKCSADGSEEGDIPLNPGLPSVSKNKFDSLHYTGDSNEAMVHYANQSSVSLADVCLREGCSGNSMISQQSKGPDAIIDLVDASPPILKDVGETSSVLEPFFIDDFKQHSSTNTDQLSPIESNAMLTPTKETYSYRDTKTTSENIQEMGEMLDTDPFISSKVSSNDDPLDGHNTSTLLQTITLWNIPRTNFGSNCFDDAVTRKSVSEGFDDAVTHKSVIAGLDDAVTNKSMNAGLDDVATNKTRTAGLDDTVTHKSVNAGFSITHPLIEGQSEMVICEGKTSQIQNPLETFETTYNSLNSGVMGSLFTEGHDCSGLDSLSQNRPSSPDCDESYTVSEENTVHEVDTVNNFNICAMNMGQPFLNNTSKVPKKSYDNYMGNFSMQENDTAQPNKEFTSTFLTVDEATASTTIEDRRIEEPSDDAFGDEEDIYQEQSIYDLYKPDSEEDIPESLRFNEDDDFQIHQTEDLTEADNLFPPCRFTEIQKTEDENTLYLHDIARLFNGIDIPHSAEDNPDANTQNSQSNADADTFIKDEDDNKQFMEHCEDQSKNNYKDHSVSCESNKVIPKEAIVHNPSVKKLRRNSSKLDVLSKSKQHEETPLGAPPEFSEQFSKHIHEKLTREGLYDISKPVLVNGVLPQADKQDVDISSNPAQNAIDPHKVHDINTASEFRYQDVSSTLNKPMPFTQAEYINVGNTSEDQSYVTGAKDENIDSETPQRFFDTTSFCFESKQDKRQGVYTSKTFYEKRIVYDNQRGKHQRPESPFPGEKSIYDAYPSCDTDDESREQRVSLTYMEKKVKRNRRMRIIERICKITSGISQDAANRKPLKIFRGNPIC